MTTVTGCIKDRFNFDHSANDLPPQGDYFDFRLTESSQLSVNYDVPGLNAIIEVYGQNPMMEDSKTKKEDITPIYVAYTNDGKYEGKMVIPTAVTEAYVYTKSMGAPRCVKLNATENGFEYDITKRESPETRSSTMKPFPQYVVGIIDKDVFPYEVATSLHGGKRNDNLYSLTAWQPGGWEAMNMDYYKKPTTFGAENEKLGDITARFNELLETQREIDGNKSLLRNPEDINIKVPATATEGMGVNVTYVGENASFFNTFGYYYYEDKGQTLTPDEFLKIRKYIIIPNTASESMSAGETVQLLYFDKNGVESDKFPANYVIGWFLIANGFGSNSPFTGEGGYPNGGLIKQLPVEAYTSASAYTQGRYSCMSDDRGDDRRFISLYDTKSKLRVIGIEDYLHTAPDDYMDLTFVVQTSLDLGGGELPPVGPENPEPEPAVWSVTGTLAYEDIWPNGGDYDLNDVIVEYSRDITFGIDNIVTHIKEVFKPVQKSGSAGHDNFFACQYEKMGKVTLQTGVALESATNSFYIEASAKTIAGNSYVIERDMSGLGVKQEDAQKDFNPYIIAGKYRTEKRVEVHLPMHEMTSAADQSLMNKDNAYYVAKSKIYPFAIDIPILGFIPAQETKKISDEGQYPSFAKWASSKGEECKDWYLQDKGKK